MGTATGSVRVPAWLLGLVPLLLIVGGIALFAALDAPGIGERLGPPAEELAVERTVLEPGIIELTVRNDGPDAVSVAQAVVNDAFAQFTGADAAIGRLETATVRITQPWVEGESYEIALVTSTGGTIVHEIPVAVETPVADAGLLRADGAAGRLRRRDPGRARHALAAVAAAGPARVAARADGADDRPARLPGRRRGVRGLRAGRRGLAGVRRRGARVRRRGGRLPAAERRLGVAVEARPPAPRASRSRC